LVAFVPDNPYLNPENPPVNPDEITGFCAMQWSDEVDPSTGLKRYRLANFGSEQEVLDAGFVITHQGQCASCSSLQDLGVYVRQNLTDSTRRCGLLGKKKDRTRKIMLIHQIL